MGNWEQRAQLSEPTAELLEYRWMLEELRVSFFAPELKTAYPVSVVRLQKMWQEIVNRQLCVSIVNCKDDSHHRFFSVKYNGLTDSTGYLNDS